MKMKSIIKRILCICRPTSQPMQSEKTMSLTRVPGSHPLHSRPLRPRTAPGPYTTGSKPPTLSSSSQQVPSSKSSITSVVAPSDSLQQTTTETISPSLDENDTTKEVAPAKRGVVSSSRGTLDQGKSSSASKPHSRKSSESEFEIRLHIFMYKFHRLA